MTERLIDGYRLINIDVDSKANMPFTWPLVACLNLINALLDVSSQILGDFRFYCLRIFRILLVVVPNTSLTELDVKTDTRSPLFAASKDGRNTVTGTTRQMTSTPNVLMQMSSHHMKHTGARIVYSSNSSCTHTPSYILFFDNLPTYQTHLPGSAKPSALRVVNIAAEMGDRSFFEVARLLHDLKFNSLKGKLRQLFSFHEYRLELVKVENDKTELRWSLVKDSLSFESRYVGNNEETMSWNDIVITSLQHHFRFLPYKTQKNFITSAFPQRNVPLLDADVFSETQGGAIYGVALVKQPSYARILSYNLPFTISFLWSLFATIWVGTGLNSRMIGLIWVWLTSIMVASTCRIVQIERPGAIWKLIRDRYSSMLTKLLTKEQPLQVGFIRLTFFCECGKRFFEDIDQSQVDLKPLVAIIRSRHRTNTTTEEVAMGTLSIAIGPKLLQGDSNEAEAGNTEHTADSRLRATNLLFETPIIANEKGKFKITDTGSIDITDATDTYESEQSTLDTELERYLIVCFPNPSGHVMWHRSLKRKILDDELIQEIRKIYCQLRPAWRRLVELRGFGSVRLAKFGVAHEKEQGRVVVIPEKWDWPQKDDRNWVYAFDDSALSVEGFSKLMVHHWITKGHNKHRARTEKPKVKNAIHSSNQWLPEVSIYRQNKAITLPSYQHFEDDHISDKVFWLHLAKVVKIYFPRASTGSEDTSKSDMEPEEDDTEWFSSASIEIDLGSISPEYLIQATPKKCGKRLYPDEKGKVVRIGWGILIDEDFSVPWYVPLIVGSLSLVIFVFAVWYTSKHGPPANGWTIGSFILMNVTFMFNIWVLRTKDSKHP